MKSDVVLPGCFLHTLFIRRHVLNRSLRVVPDDEPLASSLNDLFRDVVVRQRADLKEEENEVMIKTAKLPGLVEI